jgi:hypothetical protein
VIRPILDFLKLLGMFSLALVFAELGKDAIKATAVVLWKKVALSVWAVMMLKGRG